MPEPKPDHLLSLADFKMEKNALLSTAVNGTKQIIPYRDICSCIYEFESISVKVNTTTGGVVRFAFKNKEIAKEAFDLLEFKIAKE